MKAGVSKMEEKGFHPTPKGMGIQPENDYKMGKNLETIGPVKILNTKSDKRGIYITIAKDEETEAEWIRVLKLLGLKVDVR